MGTAAVALRGREETTAFRSPAELREVLDALLAELDTDERLGPLLRSARLRLRLEFTDAGLALNLASSANDEHNVEWSFAARPPWRPNLTLAMDSAVANRWLQGAESIAVAIARGRARCGGDGRAALAFLPLARLLREPYERLIGASYRHLELS